MSRSNYQRISFELYICTGREKKTNLGANLDRERHGAKGLGEPQPVVSLRGLGEDGEFAGRGPVEFAWIPADGC